MNPFLHITGRDFFMEAPLAQLKLPFAQCLQDGRKNYLNLELIRQTMFILKGAYRFGLHQQEKEKTGNEYLSHIAGLW